jgi:hypothetical protein
MFLLALATAPPAASELVVLVEGGVLKVEEYRLEGERAHLTLPSGGVLKLPLLRIERVVDDEIVPESEPAPDLPGSVEIGFRESHPVPETPYGKLIYDTAKRHQVNPGLVAAMVETESAFDPYAVSPKGASGLLQLMPATAKRFGLDRAELFDPTRNLDAGVRYLKWLSQRFEGNLPHILAGYNAGEATVDRYEGVPPFRETRNYIRRIYDLVGATLQSGL